jgi:hypothetical protein
MSIADNLSALKLELPPDVELVAVSKFKPVQMIMEAYNAGQRSFGENRPQELREKIDQLPGDVKWHFIGHLQTNKIKYIIEKVHLIQSVDSLRLLEAIDKESAKYSKVTDCLLEMFVASEETKQGMSREEIFEAVKIRENYKNVRICGLMAMATFTDDDEQIAGEFASVKSFYDELKGTCFKGDPAFSMLSMGMSGDYRIALHNGSNVIRIGTAIFGGRS